ncbi:unnamed protein product [Moneuplotes crassus]|uniref:Uncharacterized protein n=1 Tax=Euplotes crassus TaxID=5936 RepID=A0AAD1X6D3_EUPCR|nr:unnamed protein product [Moneuplotes crassus]
MKGNHIIPRRLQCSDLACKQHRFYFCRDHQVYSCKGCVSKMHYKCQIAIIQDLIDLRTDVKEVQKLVIRFQELATENGLEVYLPNIDSVIKDYLEDLIEIERKIDEAIARDHHEQFDTLRSQIREYVSKNLQIYTLQLSAFYQLTLAYRIQNRMADEQVIKDILFLSTTRDASRYGLPRVSDEFSSAIKVEQTIDTVVKQNVKLMEKKLEKEVREIEQQCKDRLSEEFKERIQELKEQKESQDIEIEEQKLATEQVLRQAQDMLKQKQEAFAENQVLQDQKAQLERELSQKVEEIKQAKDQNKKYQEEISKMIEEIKENTSYVVESKDTIRDRIKSTHKDFDLDSTKLELNMKEEKTKKLVKAMEESKYSLGDMHKLKIDRMVNGDTSLNKFMTYSSPFSLKLFVFNHSYPGYGDKAVRIKFYLEGLKEIIPKVTKEVYLECLVVDDTDLSRIVTWASNAERLTIRCSKISTSASLDFSTPSKAKLKYLSFFNCGNRWCNMRWDESPEKFEQIIVAIKNSSLKDSLTQVNVSGCKISTSKVSELLNSHCLSHISVIDEENKPLAD